MTKDVISSPSPVDQQHPLPPQVWDLRKEEVTMTLKGHTDSITGMKLSPDGTHLLTNSMDNTLRIWDMRPYAPEDRCTKARGPQPHPA